MFSPGFWSGNKPVILCFILLCFNTIGQVNLVYNGDFEIYDTCPDDATQVERCLGWVKPNNATSDYFNSCAAVGSGASLPTGNFAGYQEAQSGEGYMGLIGYSMIYPQNQSPYLWVEYIQGKLIQPLKKDSIYKVSMYVNMGNFSNVANKRIGVYLSQNPISSNNTLPFYYEPQILSTEFITDSINWVLISSYFQASGSEEYITIGDFYRIGEIDTLILENNLPAFLSSYYLVDNMSVVQEKYEIPNIFTPNGDGINDVIDFSFLPNSCYVQIINRWGNNVFESTPTNTIWNPSDLSDGVYFYVLKDIEKDKQIKTGFIHLIR